MKIVLLSMMLLLTVACNPELSNVGSSPDDMVKYFKVTSAKNGIGDGVVVIAHIGEKRLMTFYLRQPSGKFSHTDIMIKKSSELLYEVESVHSQTPDCKLNPDKGQAQYYEQLLINGEIKPFNREILTREEAMKENKVIGC